MLKSLVVFCSVVVVGCGRQNRLFSFDYQDRDISVNLDFSIPFISIPLKKTDSLSLSELPTININPTSLALGGTILLGATVLLPLLMKGYTHTEDTGYAKYSRLLDNTDISAESVLGFASTMLTDGRGLRGCALRLACWAATEHYNPPRILGQLVNNKLISTMVNSTAIEDAMLSGRNGRDCEVYSPCPLQKRHVPMLMKNLAAFTKML